MDIRTFQMSRCSKHIVDYYIFPFLVHEFQLQIHYLKKKKNNYALLLIGFSNKINHAMEFKLLLAIEILSATKCLFQILFM